MSPDRRTFLRRALAAGLAGPLVGSLACREAPTPGAPGGAAAPGESGARPREPDPAPPPSLRGWSGDAVHLTAPLSGSPVAYLSMRERRVYVDRSRRDRAERLLGAYVSVTTGFWRIPLMGDDPRVPITPGDEAREFEEVDLALWDPEARPSEGDVRAFPGTPTSVEISLACVPLAGGGGWVSGETFGVERLVAGEGDGGREYFGPVGAGRLQADAACAGAGTPVRILSWATRTSVAGGSAAGG
ncbi:MAG: hypothetical protein AMXMBFR53_23050 [Gemmatimonadota bacterium]